MSEHLPTSVLFFNLHDPSHRAYLPAETHHANQLHCHPLSVVTAISVQDSSGVHELFPLTHESIEEQARCVLEDINIQAIKVNHLYSIEAISATAQIAADYDKIPMILTLGAHYFAHLYEDEDEVDQLIDSYFTVLVPHAHTIVIDVTYAEQWMSSECEFSRYEDLVSHCFELGAEYCVVLSNSKEPHLVYNTLYHQSGQIEHFTYDPPALHQAEFADVFSTALVCLLAQQLSLPEACKQALIDTLNQFSHQITLGMGRPQINRTSAYQTPST